MRRGLTIYTSLLYREEINRLEYEFDSLVIGKRGRFSRELCILGSNISLLPKNKPLNKHVELTSSILVCIEGKSHNGVAFFNTLR